MARRFEELDAQETRLGLLTLRWRVDPALRAEVYEVKLGEEFLMSSAFTHAERALARLGLAAVAERTPADGAPAEGLDVLNGGLGLGYTALEALADERVRSLTVVDGLREVIGWHERGLLPETALMTDSRTRLVEGDFFAMMRGEEATGAGPDRFHAILLDVDHSTTHVLHPSHAGLYTVDGLTRLRGHLHPGGAFALWSDDPPEPGFVAALGQAFDTSRAEVVTFPNPLTRGEASATIYVATRTDVS